MSRGRYPQIDIMKRFAILGVLFTHAAIAPVFYRFDRWFGWSGPRLEPTTKREAR
jgi:peptidoglycan/LPS O-acetylase OafA/YrhL